MFLFDLFVFVLLVSSFQQNNNINIQANLFGMLLKNYSILSYTETTQIGSHAYSLDRVIVRAESKFIFK